MHREIFTEEQLLLLPSVSKFSRSFYLVGGTAIALHLGHRRSIDFDLFTSAPLAKTRIRDKTSKIPFKKVPLFEDVDQIHMLINNVKVTFFHFPYAIAHPEKVEFIGSPIPETEIREFLIARATEI